MTYSIFRVLLDEWSERPWTTTSENGNKLIELFTTDGATK